MASLGGLLNKVSIGSNSNSNNNHNAQATASSSSPVGWDSFIRRGGAGAGHSNGQPPPVPQPPPPNPVYYNKYQHGPNARSASSSTAASHHSNSTDFHLTATSSSSTSIDSHRISGPNSPFATTFHAQPRAFPPPLEPRSYTILKEVGDGSFGTVWLADWHSPLQLPPGTAPPGPSSRPEYKGKKLVAVKRMKKAFEGGWEECLKLKELRVSGATQFFSAGKSLAADFYLSSCSRCNRFQCTTISFLCTTLSCYRRRKNSISCSSAWKATCIS